MREDQTSLTSSTGARTDGRTSVAAPRSTLSIPTPARPTTRRRPFDASNTSRVTCGQQLVSEGSSTTQAGARAPHLGPTADNEGIDERNLRAELLRRQIVAAIDICNLLQKSNTCPSGERGVSGGRRF